MNEAMTSRWHYIKPGGPSQEALAYAQSLIDATGIDFFSDSEPYIVATIARVVEVDIRALLERHVAEVARHHAVAPGHLRFAADLIKQGEHRQSNATEAGK
jgi:hypothetical protein